MCRMAVFVCWRCWRLGRKGCVVLALLCGYVYIGRGSGGGAVCAGFRSLVGSARACDGRIDQYTNPQSKQSQYPRPNPNIHTPTHTIASDPSIFMGGCGTKIDSSNAYRTYRVETTYNIGCKGPRNNSYLSHICPNCLLCCEMPRRRCRWCRSAFRQHTLLYMLYSIVRQNKLRI